jgi:hypothetical protein
VTQDVKTWPLIAHLRFWAVTLPPPLDAAGDRADPFVNGVSGAAQFYRRSMG